MKKPRYRTSRGIMNLAIAPKGRYKVESLPMGTRARFRLIRMGIRESSIIKVVSNAQFTPVVIEVLGSKLSVGRGLASKVMVKRIIN